VDSESVCACFVLVLFTRPGVSCSVPCLYHAGERVKGMLTSISRESHFFTLEQKYSRTHKKEGPDTCKQNTSCSENTVGGLTTQ